MATPNLTAERLRELFSYDPETGIFRSIVRRSGVRFGAPAGSPSGNLYIYIVVDGKKYGAHRLAWLYTHGEWPPEDIDHKNGDRADNRIANLRAVPRYVNNQNRPFGQANNLSSGVMGVNRVSEGNKWRAKITLHGRTKYLGRFETIEEAREAYVRAKRQLHEGCLL